MSIGSVTQLSSMFEKGLFTINVTVNGTTETVDESKDYGVDAIYTVQLNYGIDKVPLALLFAAMQIGLSEVSAYKAESYMNKITENQEKQIACGKAIAAAEKMQDASVDTVSGYVAANSGWAKTDTLTASSITITGDTGPTGITVSDSIKSMDQALLDTIRAFCTENNVTYVSSMSSVTCTEGKTTTTDKPVPDATYTDLTTISYAYTFSMKGLTASGDIIDYKLSIPVTDVQTKYYTYDDTDGYKNVTSTTYPDEDVHYEYLMDDVDKKSASTPSSIYGTTITQEFVDLCKDAGVTTFSDGTEIKAGVPLTDAQLDDIIEELELNKEEASSTLQTDMVYAEEAMGQYTAYLTGGSTNIDDLSNALQTLAQRI